MRCPRADPTSYHLQCGTGGGVHDDVHASAHGSSHASLCKQGQPMSPLHRHASSGVSRCGSGGVPEARQCSSQMSKPSKDCSRRCCKAWPTVLPRPFNDPEPAKFLTPWRSAAVQGRCRWLPALRRIGLHGCRQASAEIQAGWPVLGGIACVWVRWHRALS